MLGKIATAGRIACSAALQSRKAALLFCGGSVGVDSEVRKRFP
jgi:hypothetical protein